MRGPPQPAGNKRNLECEARPVLGLPLSQSDVFAPGEAIRNVEILYVDGEGHRHDLVRQLLITFGAHRIKPTTCGSITNGTNSVWML